MVKKISDIRIHYIRQKEPRGLGHAILCAKQFIGDELLRCFWARCSRR